MSNGGNQDYKSRIEQLIDNFPIEIDKNVVISGRVPNNASSEFLTNKEQGDWAERVVLKAINESPTGYSAVPYGKNDSISAGDPGFKEFYENYQNELNTIGKRPNILVFRKGEENGDLSDPSVVGRAIAAIEVRSSSFLSERYKSSMKEQNEKAERRCEDIVHEIVREPYASLLMSKKKVIFDMLKNSTSDTFRELDFRAPSWSSSEELKKLSEMLKEIKANIKVLQKRDHLSITPKLEDLALVNRWISTFNVPHYYLQVFFDKAYMISFERILTLCSLSENEGTIFSIETDVKNQGKTTVKVDIAVGTPVIGKIDMPEHKSVMKELDRGRLLFYVKFENGQGYLDLDVFNREITG